MPISPRKMVSFAISLALLMGGAFVLAPAVSAQTAQPAIRAVGFELDQSTNTITTSVFGSGFGQPPAALPYNGDVASFVLQDLTSGWNAGYEGGALCSPNQGCSDANFITGDYMIWTTTEIEVTFDPANAGATWEAGDSVYVAMANPQSGMTASWTGSLANYKGPVASPVPNLTVGRFPSVSIILPLTSPYTKAQFAAVGSKQMATSAKYEGHVVASVARLSLTQAGSLYGSATGSLLRYGITPTESFIKAQPAVQVAESAMIVKSCASYLTSLVDRYVTDVYAARVPWNSLNGLGSWWQVVLQVRITTGATYDFVVTGFISKVTSSTAQEEFKYALNNTPIATAAALAQSLAKELYYAETVVPG